mgnify:FL=1
MNAASTDTENPGFFRKVLAWICTSSTQLLLGLIAILLVFGILFSGSSQPRWEYQYIREFQETPRDRNGSDAFKATMINPSPSKINALGEQGWELAGCYLEPETAWPNFGKDEYVTGLQPNVRAQSIVMIFKRRL